jgi:hypothetical protein
MKIFRNRLLVTLVLTAIVSTFVSSGALAALRLPSTTTTAGSSVSGVSGIDRTASPMSGEPDVGQSGQPLGTKSMGSLVSGGGTLARWWFWTSWIWATLRIGR